MLIFRSAHLSLLLANWLLITGYLRCTGGQGGSYPKKRR
jgi:hypothetical protein